MPNFKNPDWIASLGERERARLIASNTRLGYHPKTRDAYCVPILDRFAGMYVLGVQGTGKSGFLQNLIAQDIAAGRAVVVIDPHGDLVDNCIAQLIETDLLRTYLLDLLDEAYPFGINVFAVRELNSAIAQAQSIDRVLHLFQTLWPETESQQHLPNYLRAVIITLLANPGKTLVDALRLLKEDSFRQELIKSVSDPMVLSLWQSYDEMTRSARDQKVAPLVNRLLSLFMGRSIISNIVGQAHNTFDPRKAIEERQIIFIKLPLKVLAQDARLIGTMLIAQIHAALFSFVDLPEKQRPGFSLYVDEFQHFSMPDFSEMFTEGRKFGVRVTLAHQYRGQLPAYLQDSTGTARNKVCFQITPDDAREMAQYFPSSQVSVRPEDIDPLPVEHLLKCSSDFPEPIQIFIEYYLREVVAHRKGKNVEILDPGFQADHIPFWLLGQKAPEETLEVDEPIQYLNPFLREVMKTGRWDLPIPHKAIYGFSNCGQGFFQTYRYWLDKEALLSHEMMFPPYLVVPTPNGDTHWTRAPESGKEQLYHFLYHLRLLMKHLAQNPIGKKTTLSTTDVAQMLTQLPRRAAFVRSGNESGVIFSDDTVPMVDAMTLRERLAFIQNQTRQKYCTAKTELEKEPKLINTAKPKTSFWEAID